MVAKLGATPVWRIFGVTGALQSGANFGELRQGEVRRFHLLGTSVNRVICRTSLVTFITCNRRGSASLCERRRPRTMAHSRPPLRWGSSHGEARRWPVDDGYPSPPSLGPRSGPGASSG